MNPAFYWSKVDFVISSQNKYSQSYYKVSKVKVLFMRWLVKHIFHVAAGWRDGNLTICMQLGIFFISKYIIFYKLIVICI